MNPRRNLSTRPFASYLLGLRMRTRKLFKVPAPAGTVDVCWLTTPDNSRQTTDVPSRPNHRYPLLCAYNIAIRPAKKEKALGCFASDLRPGRGWQKTGEGEKRSGGLLDEQNRC